MVYALIREDAYDTLQIAVLLRHLRRGGSLLQPLIFEYGCIASDGKNQGIIRTN